MKEQTKDQCGVNNRECIKEALETLSKYKADPFTIEFMKKFDLPIKAGPKANRDEIRKRVGRKSQTPNCNELLEYVDELKMYGKQHVVLFSLKKNEMKYLKDLARPEFIQKLLKRKNKGNRYDNNVCRYKSNKPFLSEVRHFVDDDNIAKLRFKWILTRHYQGTIKNRIVILPERSVTYLIINLIEGSAQLRIQLKQSNSLLKIKDEIEIYKKEIGMFLDLNKFDIISLAPIMRKFLYKSILRIKQYRVVTKSGIFDGAPTNPTIIKKLIYPFRKILPTELKLCWNCDQVANTSSELHIIMKSGEDTITFPAKTDKLKTDFILSNIYKLRTTKRLLWPIKMKELNILASKFPEYRIVFRLIDQSFQNANNKIVKVSTLISKTWFDEKDIKKVFKLAADEFPQLFVFGGEGENTFLRINIQDEPEFNGISDKITRSFKKSKNRKRLKNIVQWSVIPGLGSFVFILDKITGWLINKGISKPLGVPFWVIEVILELLFVLGYLDIRRVVKNIYEIPKKYIVYKITAWYYRSQKVVITKKEFDKWLLGRTV